MTTNWLIGNDKKFNSGMYNFKKLDEIHLCALQNIKMKQTKW